MEWMDHGCTCTRVQIDFQLRYFPALSKVVTFPRWHRSTIHDTSDEFGRNFDDDNKKKKSMKADSYISNRKKLKKTMLIRRVP